MAKQTTKGGRKLVDADERKIETEEQHNEVEGVVVMELVIFGDPPSLQSLVN